MLGLGLTGVGNDDHKAVLWRKIAFRKVKRRRMRIYAPKPNIISW